MRRVQVLPNCPIRGQLWDCRDLRRKSRWLAWAGPVGQHHGGLVISLSPLFTALHGMPAWTSFEKGVCLSVCPSAKRVDSDKMEERSVQIFIPYEITHSLVFWEEELVGATPSTGNFRSSWPRWSEIADF